MSSSGEFGNPLRKFKLVFLGEQSGKLTCQYTCQTHPATSHIEAGLALGVPLHNVQIWFWRIYASIGRFSLKFFIDRIWLYIVNNPWLDIWVMRVCIPLPASSVETWVNFNRSNTWTAFVISRVFLVVLLCQKWIIGITLTNLNCLFLVKWEVRYKISVTNVISCD